MTPPTPQEIALVRALAIHFGRQVSEEMDCLPLIRAHVETESNASCPHVVRGSEGTQYCALAESSVLALRKERDKLAEWRLNAQITIRDLTQEAVDIEKERAELAEWKENALAVEREWDVQAVGKLLGVTLGHSVRRNIEPKIRELVEWRERALVTMPELKSAIDDGETTE